jgi:hypothetical protein
MANSLTYKKNKQFFFNSALLLVAAVLAVGVASVLTNPNFRLSTQGKAAYKLEELGAASLECDSFRCWAKLMDIQHKYLNREYKWMTQMVKFGSNSSQTTGVTSDAAIFVTIGENLPKCLNDKIGNSYGDQFKRAIVFGQTIPVNHAILSTLDQCLTTLRE